MKTKAITLTTLCIIILITGCSSKSKQKREPFTLDREKYETANSVLKLPGNQYLVTGNTSLAADKSMNGYLVLFDQQGTIIKEKVFERKGEVYFYQAIPAVDTGFILIGLSKFPGETEWDIYVQKINTNWNLQWEKNFGNTGRDNCSEVISTEGGSYVIAGQTIPPGSETSDFYLLNMDKAGNVIWERTFGTEGNDSGQCVLQTDDEGFVVGGHGGIGNKTDVLLIKTDKYGNEQWRKQIGNEKRDWGNSMLRDAGNNLVITGFTDIVLAGKPSTVKIFTAKFDINGGLIWEKNIDFPGRGTAISQSIASTRDGNYIIGGAVMHEADIGFDLALVKLAPDGSEIWKQVTDKPGAMEYCNSVAVTADGGYLVAGYTSIKHVDEVDGSTQTTFRGKLGYLVKFNSNGQPE